MSQKQRIDQLLVSRGLFESRARAQAAIAAGLVRVNGAQARKASDSVNLDARVEAEEAFPWVSRGGVKLAHALDHFQIDAAGRICLDVGSSTGGFTDVLLSRDAKRVIAVDSGRDQMRQRLRGDARIALHEETDIRNFKSDGAIDASLIVVDVSFISLRLVLPALGVFAAPEADLIALIKPQFEVGRAHVGKKGIVTGDSARRQAIDDVSRAAEAAGWRVADIIDSPIEGGDGNREYLMRARRAS